MLGKLTVPGRPTIWITVGQGPIALAVGAGGGGLDIFTLIYLFSSFSLSLGDCPIWTEILSQRAVKPQTTNQPTDEECVISWAVQNKISSDAIERLFKEGFTSKEAMKVLDSDALGRTKIPRGQQNLILASVARLLKSKDSAGHNAQAQSQDNPNRSTSSAAVAQTSYNDQSSATGTGTPSTMAAPRWMNNRQEQIS